MVQYRFRTIKAIAVIVRRGKLPFLVGGSPFYIYSVVDGWTIPEVKPNFTLRKQLEKLPTEQLLKRLQKLDPKRTQTIEQKNRRRLIRALEIVLTTKKPVPQLQKHPLPYPVLFLGVKKLPAILRQDIRKRFLVMLRRGFLNETRALRKNGLSWNMIESFGLEYRQASQYLQGNISKQEMINSAVRATEDFARRQISWFKKDPRIHWIKSSQAAEILVRQFLLGSVK